MKDYPDLRIVGNHDLYHRKYVVGGVHGRGTARQLSLCTWRGNLSWRPATYLLLDLRMLY